MLDGAFVVHFKNPQMSMKTGRHSIPICVLDCCLHNDELASPRRVFPYGMHHNAHASIVLLGIVVV